MCNTIIKNQQNYYVFFEYLKLQYELQDIVFLESDYDTLSNTRILQSPYVKKLTEYPEISLAAYAGNLDNMKWLYKHGYKWTTDKSGKIGRCKNLSIIELLDKHEFIWNTDTVVTAMECNNAVMINYLCDNVYTDRNDMLNMLDIAFLNDIDMIKLVYGKMKPWNSDVLEHSIIYGCLSDRLEIPEYLIDNRCPCDTSVFIQAIECGSLDIFRLLDQRYNCHDIPKLVDTAIKYRRMNIWKYIQKNMT